MFRIDNHIGIAIAGLTSDARVLRYVAVVGGHKMGEILRATMPLATLCARKLWPRRWCSTVRSPWAAWSLLSQIVRVSLLEPPGFSPDRPSHRGTGQHSGIRSAAVWRRVPCYRARPIRAPSVRILAIRRFVRVLCYVDRREESECQDVSGEAF